MTPDGDFDDGPDTELADLLDEIRWLLERYVVFSKVEQSDAVTLWVAHTYIFEQYETTPYLSVTSAEKQSGKTRLLDTLEVLVVRPWRAILPSEAVLYRKVSRDRPTLLLDEVDAIYGRRAREHEDLRALLNAGHRKGVKVPRCVGQGSRIRLEEFEVYCPKALAGIGELPDTVADRSIPIRLVRRTRDEAITRFRRRDVEKEARPVRDALEVWAKQVDFGDNWPETPAELDDRAADGWEPLLAIADSAGNGWPDRARRAAVALHTSEGDLESSLGVRLLTDLQEIFNRSDQPAVFSAELVAKLNDLEESPWGGFSDGKGLTARSLARRLRPYGIRPGSIRVEHATGKGYKRADLEDVWARYVLAPSWTAPGPSQRHSGGNSGAYADPDPSRSDSSVTENPDPLQ